MFSLHLYRSCCQLLCYFRNDSLLENTANLKISELTGLMTGCLGSWLARSTPCPTPDPACGNSRLFTIMGHGRRAFLILWRSYSGQYKKRLVSFRRLRCFLQNKTTTPESLSKSFAYLLYLCFCFGLLRRSKDKLVCSGV
jgi:hypothetical protein